jgi:predicted amidophosphoribosyltransferase
MNAVLDLFLGSVCAACEAPGRALCGDCEAGLPKRGVLSMPTPTPAGLAPAMAAGAYDGALKAMINAHKERQRLALARPLGQVLAAVVADLVPTGEVLLVPVPSARSVVRRRGHDPLLRIARAASVALRRSGRDVRVARFLHAVRRAEDQSGLDAEARQANLAGTLRGRVAPAAGALVVVDDVITTGATVREAQRALEAGGASVTGIAAIAATRRRSLPLHGQGD